MLIEDFMTTIKIAQKGYKIVYEPAAKAIENGSESISEELKRKARISAGGLQAFWYLRGLLNPFKYGVLSFQYISHRVLRWTLAPLSLILLLMFNIILAKNGEILYRFILLGQITFYILALLGYLFDRKKLRFKFFFLPFYFTFMNMCVFLGLIKLNL